MFDSYRRYLHFGSFKEATTTFTGMAQRQRAGLITPRSLDQNQFPVFYNSFALKKRTVNASDVKQASVTGVAQRLARVAHNHEDTGSKPVLRIITLSFVLQKRIVIA